LKALGIIRRIDDLGRIVIPKEIRTANGWGTNHPMELFAYEGGVLIKPYGKEAVRKEILEQLNHLMVTATNKSAVQIANRAIEYIKNEG
jgi:AbrB family looped-hinge helix DNA binding protein